MKKKIIVCIAALLAMTFNSCEQADFTPDEGEGVETVPSAKGKSVNISLRSASDTPIEYPVRVYAFDESGMCKASGIITSDAENTVVLKLPKGTYRLAAVSLPENYSLVDGDVLSSTIIRMPECGYAMKPFSTGNADVIVSSSASQSVSIRMGYRQAAVNVRLLNTPANVTSMDISLSTPYSTMSFNGLYDNAKSVTVPSRKSGDSWTTETFYVMPTQNSQTMLTMHLTFDDGSSQSYSYTYNAILNAGVPYVFTGQYDGVESDADITASIQGGEWAKPIETTFDFGPGVNSGGSHNETTWYMSSLPKAGEVVNGHVVVISDEKSSEEADIVLLSLDEWSNVYSMANESHKAETTALVSKYAENGLMEWRFPTTEEATVLNQLYSSDSALEELNSVISNAGGAKLSKTKTGGNARYLCNNGKSTFTFAVNGKIGSAGATVTYNLRLVKSITVKRK